MQESENELATMKSLLQKAWPQLLVKRIKVDDYNVSLGSAHLIEINPTEGLIVKTLSKKEVLENINFIKVEEIEALQIDTLFKVHLTSQ